MAVEWILASRQSNYGKIENLLRNGVDVNQQDGEGWSALHWASCNGDVRIVNLLLDNNAKVDIANCDLFTPLTKAAENGHLGVIEVLVSKAAANIDHADRKGWTPMMRAAANGHSKVIEYLIKHGACVDSVNSSSWTALFFAISNSQTEAAKVLLDRNANPNHLDADHSSPLFWAKNTPTACLLIDYGAEVNIKNSYGSTALHIAVQNGSSELVKLLIAAGCNVDVKNKFQLTPFMAAFRNNKTEIARILVDNGCHVNQKDARDGSTALMKCAMSDDADLALRLIRRGASVNAVDNDGWTPLLIACSSGAVKVAKLLLEYGADSRYTTTKDFPSLGIGKSWTALSIASHFGFKDLTKLLNQYQS